MTRKMLILLMLLHHVKAHSSASVNWVSMQFDFERAKQVFDVHALKLAAPFLFTEFKKLGDITIMSSEVSCIQVQSAILARKSFDFREREPCDDDTMAPATNISFAEASLVCEFLGGRLPTEAEWVSAFVSNQTNITVSDYELDFLDSLVEYAVDVDQALEKPKSLHGMVGNVWEMTSSEWPGNSNKIIMKGGAFNISSKPDLFNPFLRASLYKNDFLNGNVGFRCVK